MMQQRQEEDSQDSLSAMLAENAFDREQHEQIRGDLRRRRIGLAQNRLPARSLIEDVAPEETVDANGGVAG